MPRTSHAPCDALYRVKVAIRRAPHVSREVVVLEEGARLRLAYAFVEVVLQSHRNDYKIN